MVVGQGQVDTLSSRSWSLICHGDDHAAAISKETSHEVVQQLKLRLQLQLETGTNALCIKMPCSLS